MKKTPFLVSLGVTLICAISPFAIARSVSLDVDDTPPLREGRYAGYAPIVEKVAPSVVSITVVKNVHLSRLGKPLFGDPFLDRHLKQRPELRRGNVVPRPQGSGSGVIITKDGYIVTNYHVIKEADQIRVAVGEEEKLYDASVVGTDKSTDIAVLKIDGEEFPQVEIGASRTLKPGDFVLAIGSPFGLPQTVTQGIVSAVGRTDLGITGEAGYEDFIQTDASINPGNSGGALIDNGGRMIGINTAIFSRSGGNLGIGFAIPSDLAVNVAEQIIEFGEVRRGFLGVNSGDLTPDLGRAFEVEGNGAIVHEVVPGSPAERAGLKSGDIITGYNGNEVDGAARLRLMVGATRPGTAVSFQLVRDRETKVIEGEIGSRKKDPRLSENKKKSLRGASNGEFLEGLELSNIGADVRIRLGIPSDVNGVLVESIVPNSVADNAGLRPGEVISEIAREPIRDLADAMKKKSTALANTSDGVVLLRVFSETGSRYLAVELS